MYIGINKSVIADYNTEVARLTITPDTITKYMLKGRWKGMSETFRYNVSQISNKIYLIYWTEEQTGARVTQVQNWNTMEVNTHVVIGNEFIHMKGKLYMAR